MRRGRTLILVLLIVIIGLVVAFVALRQIITPPVVEEQTLYVDIFYAAQYIPQGGGNHRGCAWNAAHPPGKCGDGYVHPR